MPHCCVPCCSNSTKKKSPVSFHKFPKEKSVNRIWIVNIRRDPGKEFNLTAETCVCSAHFKPDDYLFNGYSRKRTLKSTAVPTLFTWDKPPIKTRKSPTKRQRTSNDLAYAFPSTSCDALNRNDDLTESEAESENAETPMVSADHDYNVDSQHEQTKLEAAILEIERLNLENEKLKSEKCFYSLLAKDDKSVSFYTGFKTYCILMAFFQAIVPTAESMLRYSQVRRQLSGTCKTNRIAFSCQKLSLVDQFILTLRRLRVGTCAKELADIYGVHESTVSRIVITWVNYLHFVLGSTRLWPSKKKVQKHMPTAFKEKYGKTRVILDCTEMWVQRPSSLVLGSEFYSHYKGRSTMKGLVGIAPSGAVTFVSKLYPGSISDKAITKQSGILELIEEDDEVMVDKGFLIQDLLEPVGARLVIPPFLTASRPQFEKEEVSETQEIARLRVHVERAIARVKNYNIFSRVVPLTLAGIANQMWSVCCLLTNFQGDLIKQRD